MKLALMQPYFFPYVGYFQLIFESDLFVLRDDTQYIKGGWINRNRILVNGKPEWLTLPVLAGAHDVPINQRRYLLNGGVAKKLLARIEAAYRKAPNRESTLALVEEILGCEDDNVARFNGQLLRKVAARLGIDTPILAASNMGSKTSLAGQMGVIDICTRLGATHYVNSIGGASLYQSELFSQSKIKLQFLRPEISQYRQLSLSSDSGPLSIIDVLMHSQPDAIGRMLREYRLVPG